MIIRPQQRPRIRQRLPGVVVGLCASLYAGVAQSAVNGMTLIQFTNTGVVTSSALQFENNVTNNTATVGVLPKGLEITKSADTSALSNPVLAGDSITYNITAKSLGLLGLTNIEIDDSIIATEDLVLVSGDVNNDAVLDANEIWQWQGTYQVTQADIDTNGGGDADIDNTVTISTDELPPITESVAVPIIQAPAFAITKVVDQDSIATPVTLNYVIEITNTGNQTLTGLAPSDTLPDGSAATLTGPTGDAGQIGKLDPGEVWQFTSSYSATQVDIDTGTALSNTVSVVANETGATAQTATAQTAISTAPEFTVAKTVDNRSVSGPGILNYTIAVENTGNVSLTGVTPTDTLPDGTIGTLSGPLNDTGISGVLDVAETWTYSTSYPVSQAAIDAGTALLNSVEVVSNETGSTPVRAQATTEITSAPSWTVAKVVDQSSIATPGTLTYDIDIVNTGNVTLNNINIIDLFSNGSTVTLTGPATDTGQPDSIDVGETWQYTAVYAVTQADIDAGVDLTNTVTVNPTETALQSATATTTINNEPALSVVKSVDMAAANTPTTASYVISVTNTGNTSLTYVTPIDTLPNGTTAVLNGPLADIGTVDTLDVGETWRYTTTYAIGQSDIDAGQPRTNTVEVTTAETGTETFAASATTTITASPSFTVHKTVDQPMISEPGTLAYEISIVNTGNVTLTNISVNDDLPDGTTTALGNPTVDVGITGAIDVGETWTYNTGFEVTQRDIDAGESLVNTVHVTTDQAGAQTDSAQTTVAQQPQIRIVKAATDTQFIQAGDVINYAFLVSNIGNILLTDVLISDPQTDAGSIRCLPPGQPVSAQLSTGPFVLAPAEQMNCTAIHTVTVADVSATKVDNQATVTASDPKGNTVTADSQVITVELNTIPPLATDDHFNSPASGVPVTLPGGENDSDENGDIDITTVNLLNANAVDSDNDGDNDQLIVSGEGAWVVDDQNGNVTFTPDAGFTGDPASVSYTVSDLSGLASKSAALSINYPQTVPLAKNDFKANTGIPSPQNPTVLNVLVDNGDGADTDPEGDLDIQSIALTATNATDTDSDGDADTLMVPGEGVWQINNTNGDLTFTPDSGFFADPTPIFYTVSDNTGLVSNAALVTIDYPQTAPLAVNDELLNQPLAQPVVIAVLDNDSDPENNLDASSVKIIDPVTNESVAVFPVAGEGVWRVDSQAGDISFTPDPGFLTNPTPVNYTVFDSTGLESNQASVTISFEPTASIAGTVWLDTNRDGQVSANEEKKADWTLRLLDGSGNVVATATTDDNGNYEFPDLVPAEYTVEFFNEFGVFMDRLQTNGPIVAGQMMLLPLPIVPTGVVYDSISRTPVEGVKLNLINTGGRIINPVCLRENQQGQITSADGLYAFNINPGAHSSCSNSEIYRIEIASAPIAYHPNFSSIIRQQGAESCGTPEIGCAVSETFDSDPVEARCTIDTISNSNACEIQPQPGAPQSDDDTRYFVELAIESGDSHVVFNHLPIDARANDAAIVLNKTTDRRETSIGSLVRYTITAENLKQIPAFNIEIVDTPPAGFSYVPESVLLTRAGEDGQLNTKDDSVSSIDTSIINTMTLEPLDLAAEESLQISYMMRIGTGTLNGRHVNRVIARGGNGETSNEAIATVDLVPNPALLQATLTGKVFWDHDRDGIQDPAAATRLMLQSDYYGKLMLPDLPSRVSFEDDPNRHAITLNMPRTDSNRLSIFTEEGTRIEVDESGTAIERHVSDRARGINAQDVQVCTRHTTGIPTFADETTGSEAIEIVEITISNFGVQEAGIPGARLATATGLLIQTDAYGRYNIPDIDSGDTTTGRNFILKVDPASLPAGAGFTTDNPNVLRLDASALNKMNFGVAMPEPVDQYNKGCEPQIAAAYQTVEVNLDSVFFDTNDASIRPDQRGVVEDIINAIRQYGSGTITITAHTDNRGDHALNIALANKRADTLRDILTKALGDDLMSDVSVEIDPAAYQETGQ